MMSADNPPRAMRAKARELGELNRKPLPCQPVTQTIYGDAHLGVRIEGDLLESLEELLDVSDFATDMRTAEIHLRATTAIRKAKSQ
jgi:hypothetical protein